MPVTPEPSYTLFTKVDFRSTVKISFPTLRKMTPTPSANPSKRGLAVEEASRGSSFLRSMTLTSSHPNSLSSIDHRQNLEPSTTANPSRPSSIVVSIIGTGGVNLRSECRRGRWITDIFNVRKLHLRIEFSFPIMKWSAFLASAPRSPLRKLRRMRLCPS